MEAIKAQQDSTWLSDFGRMVLIMQPRGKRVSKPRDFFNNIVRPSYDAWLADPLSEWKAKAAVANADILAERVFVHFGKVDPVKVFGAKTVARFRTHLRESVCADFGLVWDIHDGHKHARLDRASSRITSADQTGVSGMGYGEGGYGEGVYGGGPQIVVELNDGSKRALSSIMLNVMAMWTKFLEDIGS